MASGDSPKSCAKVFRLVAALAESMRGAFITGFGVDFTCTLTLITVTLHSLSEGSFFFYFCICVNRLDNKLASVSFILLATIALLAKTFNWPLFMLIA